MKQKTKARGISLIVLVITIIIIIILAGAVILSLSNSNVINKAKSGIMQTDIATVKEQIKTKMAENELNGINTKIGTQLWESYYTLSVSQLQEIGITTKSDYMYDYNTGELSIKQNGEYVTPEELYPNEPQGAYIEGYLGVRGLTVATDTPVNQALKNKYTNGGIKIKLVPTLDPSFDEVLLNETLFAKFQTSLLTPIFETKSNNSGYFRLENITPGAYTLVITDNVNLLPVVKDITVTSSYAKVISTKAAPIRLYIGELDNDYNIGGLETSIMLNRIGSTDLRKYDVNKDGVVDNTDVDIVLNSSTYSVDAYPVTTYPGLNM